MSCVNVCKRDKSLFDNYHKKACKTDDEEKINQIINKGLDRTKSINGKRLTEKDLIQHDIISHMDFFFYLSNSVNVHPRRVSERAK